MTKVFGVEIGDDGHLGRGAGEGTIAFIDFRHGQSRGPGARSAAQGPNGAADHHQGIGPGGRQ